MAFYLVFFCFILFSFVLVSARSAQLAAASVPPCRDGEDAPDVPVVTTIKGSTMGAHRVAYLRGNHLTLESDPKFSDSEYLSFFIG